MKTKCYGESILSIIKAILRTTYDTITVVILLIVGLFIMFGTKIHKILNRKYN